MATIDHRHLTTPAPNSGAYLLILELREPRRIQIGRLARIEFEPGFYVYVGSAMRNLGARMGRHLRKRKTLRWHADYLRARADAASVIPLPSTQRQECAIAHALALLLAPGPRGFGSSDCRCATHLFYHPTDPRALLERVRAQIKATERRR